MTNTSYLYCETDEKQDYKLYILKITEKVKTAVLISCFYHLFTSLKFSEIIYHTLFLAGFEPVTILHIHHELGMLTT